MDCDNDPDALSQWKTPEDAQTAFLDVDFFVIYS
jgi:hypothetical protein